MLPSNTVEEMEAKVESVVEWAAAFEKEAAAAAVEAARRNMGSEDGGVSEERGGSE